MLRKRHVCASGCPSLKQPFAAYPDPKPTRPYEQGRNLLSGDMLEYKEHENVDNAAADALKQQSADDPLCLLGWQVRCMICVTGGTDLYWR